jgi:hypothetical protein
MTHARWRSLPRKGFSAERIRSDRTISVTLMQLITKRRRKRFERESQHAKKKIPRQRNWQIILYLFAVHKTTLIFIKQQHRQEAS